MARVRRNKINGPGALKVVATPALLIRFLGKVELQKGRLRTPCWVWTGHQDENGYGQFKLAGRAQWAHRVGYALIRGPIPAGREIDHRCNNTSCVNPWHTRRRAPLGNARDGGRWRHLVGATNGEI